MQVRVLTHAARRRPAFTLVELMVAMTLTLFVMVILTQVFVTSLATFSGLKAIGELQAKLRTVSSVLQADLAADHFEYKRRLSSPDLLTLPPRQGFFAIYQGSAQTIGANSAYIDEGIESGYNANAAPNNTTAPGLQSWRATNHVLHFTIRLRGDRPENYMSASVPAGSPLLNLATTFFGQSNDAMYVQPGSPFYNSQWAEVCYFLVQTGSTDDPANANATTGTPIYALYRGQYLLVPNPTGTSVAAGTAGYANISSNVNTAGTLAFNAPDDLAAIPANRTLNGAALPYPTRASDGALNAGVPPSGAALVLSGVTSFQVQVFAQYPGINPNTNAPYPPGPEFVDVGQAFPASFDSSSPGYNILAVKVTVRIWDSASQLSRQITIIQDL